MKITVRQARLDEDRDLIVQTLQDYLTPLADRSRFEWLYQKGAHGPATAWIAVDHESDCVVGVASAFPRRFLGRSGPLTAWVFGDFCISPQYRSLGPASMLQKTMLQHMEGRIQFWYDFPSDGMLSVYRRLGFPPTHQMVRLALPLQTDRFLRKAIPSKLIADGLSAIGNVALNMWQRHHARGDSGIQVSLHHGRITQEFTQMVQQVGARFGTVLERSDEYLNWRFMGHPLNRYEVVTARRQDNSLEGYCIFYQDGQDAYVSDLFVSLREGVISSLLGGLQTILHDRGIDTISMFLLADHPWVSAAKTFGFQVREAIPVLIYPANADASWLFESGKNWLIMQGDRDS